MKNLKLPLLPKVVSADLSSFACDVIILPAFEKSSFLPELKKLEKALKTGLRDRLTQARFEGEINQVHWLDASGTRAKQILVVGLGPEKEFTRDVLRDAYGSAAKAVMLSKCQSVALPLIEKNVISKDFDAAIEGFLASTYRFLRYQKEEDTKSNFVTAVNVLVSKASAKTKWEKIVSRSGIVIGATMMARNYVNEPANVANPDYMTKEAQAIAKECKLKIKVIDYAELKKRKMNLVIAVGQGSTIPPRLVHLEYKPAKKAKSSIAFVGKGVTFDSGGLSLKPSEYMMGMKTDMAGSAAVLATMWAIGKLRPDVHVHGIMPFVENMPSGNAIKPGDIVTGLKGKTVEIDNTDAEGRLILADALTYADALKTDSVVDVATLTGACVVALGPDIAGAISNDEKLCKRVVEAGKRSGEKIWPLPLELSYKRLLKSDVADMRNIGGRYGGALTAGLFLSEFTDSKSWIHLDIAGPASIDREWPTCPKGGTGFAVQTFVNLVA